MKKPTKAEKAQIKAFRLWYHLGQVFGAFDRIEASLRLLEGAKIQGPDYVFSNFQNALGFAACGKYSAKWLAHELGVKL